ncbi:MAG: hypothetical protein H7A23_22040 [Leptospiraceae bacterium]|nr:hypothetical protein [Leptospiraceae bacterium]MCP5497242.1 hypothetical protein [Leptospiraceae bacterium]
MFYSIYHRCEKKVLYSIFLSIKILVTFFIFNSVYLWASDNSTLNPIESLIYSQNYQKALEDLEVLEKNPENRTWEFYKLKGDAFLGISRQYDAANSFQKSLKINPRQAVLHLKLSQFYDSIRKPKKSFHHVRLYLALEGDDIQQRYRAIILSSRVGDLKYFQYALKRIEDTTKKSEYDIKEVLNTIETHFQKGEYKHVQQDCEKYLPYFPQEKKLHNYLYLAHRNQNSSINTIENVLIDSVAIFRDSSLYQIRLAIYLKSQKKLHRALSVFRRAFQNALIQDGFSIDEEILYHIKQVYYELNCHMDSKAIDSLIQTIRKRENQELQKLDSSIRLYNYNREYLVFALHYLAVKEDEKMFRAYSQILMERDEKRGDKELMNVFSPFEKEEMRVW